MTTFKKLSVLEYFDNKFFTRQGIKTNAEIINWWSKGQGFLNLVVTLISILTILVILFVFKNGWVIFLLPYVAAIVILINVLYSIGSLLELWVIRYLKYDWDFDKIGPIVKKIVIMSSIALVLFISILLIIDASNNPVISSKH